MQTNKCEFQIVHDKNQVTVQWGNQSGAEKAEEKHTLPVDETPDYDGIFSKPNNPISLQPLQKAVPSNTPSRNSGGTAAILPAERKKGTFNIETMTNILDGGTEKTARRRFILSPTEDTHVTDRYYWSRPKIVKEHISHFVNTHESFAGKFVPTREDVSWMSENAMLSGTMMNHYGLFMATILAQGTAEQQMWWLLPAVKMELIGAYAQTELGHGSNVRGLQTIAVYDKSTQQFVLNTPTLLSIKWWPGTLGKVANHAIVYAQLIIDNKEHGVHAFMVQIRDKNHRPLPGIEVGDLGPKIGDHANDTGFLRLENVRILREHMLAKYQHIEEDGTYVQNAKSGNKKLHYATMMYTRGSMVKWAAGMLARACTIAIRYSCVRRQGFQNTQTTSYASEECQIIDYQMQRYRLLRQLALTYALKFTGKWMMDRFATLDGKEAAKIGENLDSSELPEIAATAAGLKGLSTLLAANGIEDCRKCCGGNGYLLNSGVAQLAVDYVWQTTAEGDFIILLLQTAKFLVKMCRKLAKGKEVSGPMSYLKPLADPDFKTKLAGARKPKSYHDFFDEKYLISLYQFRSLVMVANVYFEIEKRTASGQSIDAAWNACAVDAVYAVQSHCFTFMLSQFAFEVSNVADKNCQEVLKQLVSLFGTSQILESQWAGILDLEGLSYCRQAVSVALDLIRPNAVSLVDAFDIPDRVLCSTLGRFDGNVYEALYEEAKKSNLNQTDPYFGIDTLDKLKNADLLGLKNEKLPSSL